MSISELKFEILLAWQMAKLDKEVVYLLPQQGFHCRLSPQLGFPWDLSGKGLGCIEG